MRREIFALADGRRLAYRVLGDRNKDLPVVFLFHGMFNTGFVWELSCLWRWSPCGCVLVLLDRPGYGGSTRAPAETAWRYKDFAADVAALADHLGAYHFSVVGHSSGGPNALACAAHLPDRVQACGVLAGDPEYSHPELPVGAKDPLLPVTKLPKWAFRGLRGFENDMRTERAAYDFDLADVRCPALLFVGTCDGDNMTLGAEFIHSRLLRSSLTVLDGVGHMGMLYPWRFATILKGVVDTARKQCPKCDVASHSRSGAHVMSGVRQRPCRPWIESPHCLRYRR